MLRGISTAVGAMSCALLLGACERGPEPGSTAAALRGPPRRGLPASSSGLSATDLETMLAEDPAVPPMSLEEVAADEANRPVDSDLRLPGQPVLLRTESVGVVRGRVEVRGVLLRGAVGEIGEALAFALPPRSGCTIWVPPAGVTVIAFLQAGTDDDGVYLTVDRHTAVMPADDAGTLPDSFGGLGFDDLLALAEGA